MSTAPPPYDYSASYAPGTYPPPGTGGAFPPQSYNGANPPYGAPAQPYYPPFHVPTHHGGYGTPAAALHIQYDASTGEELRTIFITGFPMDVKERELNNMLRFMPGYQASQMNWKNNQAQGFALFDTGSSAANAMSMIAHVQFDESSILRVEMARKNMFVKDDTGGATATGNAAKRPRFHTGTYAGAPPPGVAGPGSGAPSNTTTYMASGTAGAPPVAPKGFAEVSNVGDNPPCTTLFVGNLSDDVSEAELHGLFAGQPGFKQIKVVRGARSVTSFVEFEDLNTAMTVHNSLQGAILQSSNRGGIRIQYSKNPLGKRKDM